MTKPIEISHTGWHALREQLRRDYPNSVVFISRKTREKLGFMPREHREWNKDCVMLDFYDEKKRTFFLLKYSDYIEKYKTK